MSTGSGTNHVLTVLVWLFGIFVVFWGCYGIYQEHEQEQKTEQYRSTLTPISRAEFDRQQGTLQAALDDLSAVNPDSPDHEKAQIEAQSLKREIQTQIENQKTPLFETGKDNCKARVKDQEEFPSTVEFKWFGTDSTVDKTARQITVTVDYTAKNMFRSVRAHSKKGVATLVCNAWRIHVMNVAATVTPQ
jgi:hypothetical protein